MLEIKDISAKLGNFTLSNISLEIENGDYLTVLGLSGAGKTVLLEIIAGLVKPSSGAIFLNGKEISKMSIQKRPVGLVYQDMALFPHMTVYKNIAYPMKNIGFSGKEISSRVMALARQTRVTHLLKRHPATLSGGEAQRVALARTLAAEPEVLLLDEPLASLDIKLRQELRELLKEINNTGKTIIHVTHDYMEAATLSKKIAIIEDGELIQWGKPEDVFRNPVSEFVARFSGIKNIFYCLFHNGQTNSDLITAKTPSGNIINLIEHPGKEKAHVMIPGEDIIVSENQLTTSATNQYKGQIKERYSLNHSVELIIDTGDVFSVIVSKKSAENAAFSTGKKVWISFKASAVKVL
jgi:molybdopterin-binding protein